MQKIKFLFVLPGLILASALSAKTCPIIPRPASVEIDAQQSFFEFNEYTALRTTEVSSDFLAATEKLRAYLSCGTGFTLCNFDRDSNVVLVTKDETLARHGQEAYALEISRSRITISVTHPQAIFTASQSLAQLMPLAFFSTKRSVKEQTRWEVTAGIKIIDYPRFEWRAFMLDESRHFFGEKEVKKIMDMMAFTKMNVFHWHLTDDSGWRIEIKKYPKLTQTGGWRSDSEAEDWGSGKRTGKAHQGFYTQEQIKSIVRYAAERNISVIPEIDVPGHCTAAAVCYPYLATDSVLIPPNGIRPEFLGTVVLDPSKESTFEFLSDVFDELLPLFPSKIIHIGGDEIRYDQWRASEGVNALMKKEGLSTYADMLMYFSNRVCKMVEAKGARAIGWNDVLGHDLHNYEKQKIEATGKLELPKSTLVQFWKGDPVLAGQALEKGYAVINSSHWDTYLDYNYNTISTRKAYHFDPVFEGLNPKYEKRIKGFGTQMWTEWVNNVNKLHYQIFPRLAAYSETGWTQKEHKDYEDFEARLPFYLAVLDSFEIAYSKVDRSLLTKGDFQKHTPIGVWSDSLLQVSQGEIHVDISEYVRHHPDFDLVFLMLGGDHDMEINEVSVFENGKEKALNKTKGYSGKTVQDKIRYSFSLQNIKSKAIYELRVKLKPQGGTRSHGNIYWIKREEKPEIQNQKQQPIASLSDSNLSSASFLLLLLCLPGIIRFRMKYFFFFLSAVVVLSACRQDDMLRKVPANRLVETITSKADEKNVLCMHIEIVLKEDATSRLLYWKEREPGDIKRINAYPTTSLLRQQCDILFLEPETTYNFKLELKSKDKQAETKVYQFTTGKLPPFVPVGTVKENHLQYPVKGLIHLAQQAAPGVLTFINEQGKVLWYYNNDRNVMGSNYDERSKTMVCLLGNNPDRIFASSELRVIDLMGNIVFQKTASRLSNPFIHHDAVRLKDGTVATLNFIAKNFDLTAVGGAKDETVFGDGISVYDLNGKLVWEWDCFMERTPENDPGVMEQFQSLNMGNISRKHDWLHANSLCEDSDGNFLISLHFISEIWKIDRKTKKVIWRFGQNGTLTPGLKREIEGVHAVVAGEDGIFTFLDNGSKSQVTRLLKYKVSKDNQRAELISEVFFLQEYSNAFMGNTLFIDEDRVLFGSSMKRSILIADDKGAVQWLCQMPYSFFRAQFVPWEQL